MQLMWEYFQEGHAAQVLMGNHPDTCWRDNTARNTQARRFLESTDNTFLIQMQPTRKDVLLDLI